MSTLPSSRASMMTEDQSESGMGTLSMRDKALIKRNVTRLHNSNFRAGYVPVHEQFLHKTGLRGRKTYAFWTLILLLFFLAVGNLILTFTILGVLRLGQGMESMEFLPDYRLTKFYGSTDLDRIYKRDGKLEGFGDDPLQITGDKGPVIVNVYDGKHSKISLEGGVANVTNIDKFEVVDPDTNEKFFLTTYPNFGLPKGVKKLDIKQATTRRVTSPVNTSLYVRTDTYVLLRGNEGANFDGREIVWSADQDVFLKSVNGSIVLSGKDGVFVDVRTLPLVGLGARDRPVTGHFKLCVCMPEGKLFRIAIPVDNESQPRSSQIGCHTIVMTPKLNPCQ